MQYYVWSSQKIICGNQFCPSAMFAGMLLSHWAISQVLPLASVLREGVQSTRARNTTTDILSHILRPGSWSILCKSSTLAQSSVTVRLLQAYCVNTPSEAWLLSSETIWKNTAPISRNKKASITVNGQEHVKLHPSLNINFPMCKKGTTSVTS